MASEYVIIWTAEANENLTNIVGYLQAKWTEREVEKFIIKLNNSILLISSRPKLFRVTNERLGLRKCVFTKYTSVFYVQIESRIYIVSLFDNRQDPNKMPH